MLNKISIRDFSLIRSLELEFSTGFTVISGESGAGKSLLFDAIGFVLGGRTHRSLLASGATSCEVELELALSADEARRMPEQFREGSNLIRRRYSENGRSRLTLNSGPVSAQDLRDALAGLIEIVGQFESTLLFNPDSHLGILDTFGGEKLATARGAYIANYEEYRELAGQLRALRESSTRREQEIDFLTYQVNELEEAEVLPGQMAEVEAELRLQENAEAIIAAAQTAARHLSGNDDYSGAYDELAKAELEIAGIARLLGESGTGQVVEEALDRCSGLLEGLRELAIQLNELADEVSYDPQRLEFLHARLDRMHELERKYGCTADELEPLLVEKQKLLNLLTDVSSSPEIVERKLELSRTQLLARAEALGKLRRTAAKQIEKDSSAYFRRLDFLHTELRIELSSLNEPGPEGMDSVEFLITLNPGEPARPMAQVVSGGESSRLLLGLKATLADRHGQRILLMDEIEAGLGGSAARSVADVLQEISQGRQLLAISHLPAVAARATEHLLVHKHATKERTSVEITLLDEAGRRSELGRMVGVEGGKGTEKVVDELLKEARSRG
ncbi:DNA repair protein RecN [bacterium]|nr:DNA repair protein RecN [bacterium]